MSKRRFFLLLSVAGLTCFALLSPTAAQQKNAVTLRDTVELPGYTGDFDHFAVDQARGRLLLAAEDHGTVEVFDLETGKHLRTVTGFEAPHSILIRPGAPTILVTDSGKGMSKLLDASTYEVKSTVNLTPGADSIGYDPKANIVYIVTGGKDVDMTTSELVAVDPDTGDKKGSVTIQDNHVEAMALENNGNRLFINLTQTNKVAVVDRSSMKVLATWLVPAAQQNAMAILDEPQHRLYIGCRKPGTIVVMNSDTGKITNTVPSPLRSDQLLYDESKKRLYSPGGEGFMTIYDTSDPDHLKVIAKIQTASGAKTGVLIPDLNKLVLAVSPGDSKAMAKVMTYATH